MDTDKTIATDEYATTLMRVKARQLAGNYGFTRSDREDIEQDLILHLIQQMRHFDPKRGGETTFVSRLVQLSPNISINLLVGEGSVNV